MTGGGWVVHEGIFFSLQNSLLYLWLLTGVFVFCIVLKHQYRIRCLVSSSTVMYSSGSLLSATGLANDHWGSSLYIFPYFTSYSTVSAQVYIILARVILHD